MGRYLGNRSIAVLRPIFRAVCSDPPGQPAYDILAFEFYNLHTLGDLARAPKDKERPTRIECLLGLLDILRLYVMDGVGFVHGDLHQDQIYYLGKGRFCLGDFGNSWLLFRPDVGEKEGMRDVSPRTTAKMKNPNEEMRQIAELFIEAGLLSVTDKKPVRSFLKMGPEGIELLQRYCEEEEAKAEKHKIV